MIKKTLRAALYVAVALITWSCNTPDDAIIKMTGFTINDNEKIIVDKLIALEKSMESYGEDSIAHDLENPLFFTSSQNLTVSGDYACVDLGLPSGTKWSMSNLGIKFNKPSNSIQFKDYMRVEKPQLPTWVKAMHGMQNMDVTTQEMTMQEYEELAKRENLSDVYSKYNQACADYKKSFDAARNEYFKALAQDLTFLNGDGDKYAFGSTVAGSTKYNINGVSKDRDNYQGNSQFDAATKIIGEKWGTPTKEDWDELINNTEFGFSNVFKVYIIKGKNGNVMFLPISSGYYYMTSSADFSNVGSASTPNRRFIATFSSSYFNTQPLTLSYSHGVLIRPVCK